VDWENPVDWVFDPKCAGFKILFNRRKRKAPEGTLWGFGLSAREASNERIPQSVGRFNGRLSLSKGRLRGGERRGERGHSGGRRRNAGIILKMDTVILPGKQHVDGHLLDNHGDDFSNIHRSFDDRGDSPTVSSRGSKTISLVITIQILLVDPASDDVELGSMPFGPLDSEIASPEPTNVEFNFTPEGNMSTKARGGGIFDDSNLQRIKTIDGVAIVRANVGRLNGPSQNPEQSTKLSTIASLGTGT
jgi:hypothetical protein